jgi:hypothetical protein
MGLDGMDKTRSLGIDGCCLLDELFRETRIVPARDLTVWEQRVVAHLVGGHFVLLPIETWDA